MTYERRQTQLKTGSSSVETLHFEILNEQQ